MAKRKRLEVPAGPFPPELETKSMPPLPRARMPIAEVAGEVAGRAALEEVAREMTAAEDEGRIVRRIAIAAIDLRHLTRDRLHFDSQEMDALRASLAERGQQTPVEVVALGAGRYGLVSGLRRVVALRDLEQTHVLALVRRPEGSRDAYQAMVEENEIRAGISFYERARIAVAAAGQGVYPDIRAAVKALFAHAPKAKRSKILGFVTICETIGPSLSFPAQIPEHLGLALAKGLAADPGLAGRIVATLGAARICNAAEERQVLERTLRGLRAGAAAETVAPGLRLAAGKGRAVLSGPAVDAEFLAALRAWAAARAGVTCG